MTNERTSEIVLKLEPGIKLAELILTQIEGKTEETKQVFNRHPFSLMTLFKMYPSMKFSTRY